MTTPPEAPPAPVVPPAPAPPVPGPPPADPGFPTGTPVADMTVDQQAAYWKHQSRKHEDRSKAFGDLTPEALAELREKAEKQEAFEYELSSEAEKRAADARREARAEADAEYRPRLVEAKFEALSAGRIEPEKLATILEPLDLSKFLTTDGTVDAAKVSAYVDGIAPTQSPQTRTGPSPSGQGNRSGNTRSTPGTGSVAAGRDLYAETHQKKQ
jgi:hypothetical protein